MTKLLLKIQKDCWTTYLLLFLSILLNLSVFAEIADYNTVAKGTNPTLYKAEVDEIIQLDETTFNDTVFCGANGSKCSSYVVEFYSDWCGHCRDYAVLYKAFAKDVRAWSTVIKVAAINCADSFNEGICRANEIKHFPLIKYFPRESANFDHNVKLNAYQTLSALRNQITNVILQDYAINRFSSWPYFDYLENVSNDGQLWKDVSSTVNYLAIVFDTEPNSLIGAQLLLDLNIFNDRLAVRRTLKTQTLANKLQITDFPTIVIFERGKTTPALISELRRFLLTNVGDFLQRTAMNGNLDKYINQSGNSEFSIVETRCERNIKNCQKLFYVSENDILKSMRYALIREVPRTGKPLYGANLTALRNFIDLLATHLPYRTTEIFLTGEAGDKKSKLNASERARLVFVYLRNFLDSKSSNQSITINEWQHEFNKSEEAYHRPFPVGTDWEHCKGSSPHFRGYTCGLWTTFHTLTVSAFKNSEIVQNFKPVSVLSAIRDWVKSFFGCEHCRNHFIKMTTKIAKIEAKVHQNEDVFLYLWRVHNMVNARLKGRKTEDPEYPKFQFPAPFLCPKCREHVNSTNLPSLSVNLPNSEKFNELTVKAYLLKYYSSIKPMIENPELELSS